MLQLHTPYADGEHCTFSPHCTAVNNSTVLHIADGLAKHPAIWACLFQSGPHSVQAGAAARVRPPPPVKLADGHRRQQVGPRRAPPHEAEGQPGAHRARQEGAALLAVRYRQDYLGLRLRVVPTCSRTDPQPQVLRSAETAPDSIWSRVACKCLRQAISARLTQQSSYAETSLEQHVAGWKSASSALQQSAQEPRSTCMSLFANKYARMVVRSAAKRSCMSVMGVRKAHACRMASPVVWQLLASLHSTCMLAGCSKVDTSVKYMVMCLVEGMCRASS